MSDVTLNWSSAEVRGNKLEVELRGELPKEWQDKFERTVALLPGGDWGKVRLKKDKVRVRDIREGSEDRLRHFLESVVQEANATQEGQDDEEVQDEQDAGGDEAEGVNSEMTERFRSFAEE